MTEKMNGVVEKNIPEEGRYFFQNFQKLGLKIELLLPIYERFLELSKMVKSRIASEEKSDTERPTRENSHSQDAIHMSEMAKIIWPDLVTRPEITCTLEQLQLACLLHDIGKSGPLNANLRQRQLIQMMFNTEYFSPKSESFKNIKSIRELTIAEALRLETKISDSDKQEIIDYLSTLELNIIKDNPEKLDINKHKMIDFWREHDQWTFDLLSHYKDSNIDEEVLKMASSHHLTDGRDPARILKGLISGTPAVELLDKYFMITIIDKYQAWIGRSGLSHEEAIKSLESDIARSVKEKHITVEISRQYLNCLKIIAKYENLADIMKLKK
jgi:hypothetical protein